MLAGQRHRLHNVGRHVTHGLHDLSSDVEDKPLIQEPAGRHDRLSQADDLAMKIAAVEIRLVFLFPSRVHLIEQVLKFLEELHNTLGHRLAWLWLIERLKATTDTLAHHCDGLSLLWRQRLP